MREPDPQAAADAPVRSLQSALAYGVRGLSDVPVFLKRVIQEDAWRCRRLFANDELVSFERFSDFVEIAEPQGLGLTVVQLQKVCTDLGDIEATALLEEVTHYQPGAPLGNQNAARGKTIFNNIKDCFAPEGTSAARALRDLRKKRPDIHVRVLVGELSPHAGMIAAGLRKKTLTVPINSHGIAAAIKRHFTSDQIAEIVRLLHWDREDPPSQEEAEPAA